MRKFIIKVNNQAYEVEVEEVKGANTAAKSTPASPVASTQAKAPAPVHSSPSHSGHGNSITPPMPGNILKVNVKVGDQVKQGQVVVVLEAMKMENEITAPISGKITQMKVVAGQAVGAGEVLTVIE